MKLFIKFLFLLSFVSFSHIIWAIPPTEYEFKNFNDGLKISQNTNKPIFLLFGFNKCTACNMLYNRAFKDTKLKEYLKSNFVLVYVSILDENEPDFYQLSNGTSMTNKEFVKFFKVESVPIWIWLLPSGQILASDKGGNTVPREFYMIGDKALKKLTNQ